METKNKKLFVVLGMHRSGTSAITRGLKVVGVELGDRMIPNADDNTTGFWEDIDINALNIEMLNVIGSDWHRLATITSIDMDVLHSKGYFSRAVELLRQKANSATIFGFKDPRITQLLPFWKTVFDYCQFDMNYVLSLRHPLSVAKSLSKRNSFDADKGYLMWQWHIIRSLSDTVGEKRILVDYDCLIQSPDRELDRIAKLFDLEVDPTELQNYKTKFLDQGLRHSVHDINDLLFDDSCPPIVREIYSTLLEVAFDRVKLDEMELQNKVVLWLHDIFSDEQIKSLSEVIVERDEQIISLNKSIAERDVQIDALHNSTSWRITRLLRVVSHQMKRVRHAAALIKSAIKQPGGLKEALNKALQLYYQEGRAALTKRVFDSYAEWIRRYDTLSDEIHASMRERIDGFEHKPLISVVMPTYNPKPEWLMEAIDSIRDQIYSHWELCIADDASTNKDIRSILEHYANEDSRIKVVFRKHNGHISAASNSALNLATGEYVALLDHDDLLAEHALYWVVDAINRHSDAGIIYSDEDKIDKDNLRQSPYFKCDWNYDLFLSQNLITHLGVYRSSLVREVGGFRENYEGAQDYDLALRCVEQLKPEQIIHIPRVLYHWRMHSGSTAASIKIKSYAHDAGLQAINDHLVRTGIDAEVLPLSIGYYRVHYALPSPAPLVSLIIPTRNGLKLIRQCVSSIINKTVYPNYEILIVDNGSDDPEVMMYLNSILTDQRIRILRDDRTFNFSALNNFAVKEVKGEFIGLVNNDIEVIEPEWLREMVSIASQPGVGAVGARLWYPNNSLQHGGVIVGIGGVAGHCHRLLPKGEAGYFGRGVLIQSFSAVTAACLVIRKDIYCQAGGFNERDLKVAFNDVDFCLKVKELGYRNVWTPYAELFHQESATRGREETPKKLARFDKETKYMMQRWGEVLQNDPAYNPNLTLDREDFSIELIKPRINILPS